MDCWYQHLTYDKVLKKQTTFREEACLTMVSKTESGILNIIMNI